MLFAQPLNHASLNSDFGSNHRITRLSLDRKVVRSPLIGVDGFMRLTTAHRLALIFDDDTLANFRLADAGEPRKCEALIGGWQFLIDQVRRGVFFKTAAEVRQFIIELHAHAYPFSKDKQKNGYRKQLRSHDLEHSF